MGVSGQALRFREIERSRRPTEGTICRRTVAPPATGSKVEIGGALADDIIEKALIGFWGDGLFGQEKDEEHQTLNMPVRGHDPETR